MIPELGHFALILALCIALIQATVPLIGAARGLPQWMAVARPAAIGQCAFLLLAFGLLTYSFVVSDFSVLYVANNSNVKLPLAYRISAVWGAHEGSLLLWATILSIWATAVAIFSRSLPQAMVARVLSVMALISIGFLLFMLITSNPFQRLVPAATQGRDLNPLLQDPGLVMHPPMLYMGYVGFSVAFAFATAALIGGHLDAAWARWSRPWTTVAWVFLTVGIALGSWWAYYELGWGGWWFWDPVENASFMPWLVGTALLHSLAVTEKRGAFKSWTVLLALIAFSLSLLGTFLVRSGVLTSVHAFATDPARGIFILAFLAVVVGGSLMLYAWRGPGIREAGSFELVSRESMLLVNNVLLVVAAATILLGTLYPLALDAFNLGKISVGPPYFDSVFVPLMVPLLLLIGIGPLARWKQANVMELAMRLRWYFLASIALALIALAVTVGLHSVMVVVGISLALWVAFTTLEGLRARIQSKNNLLTGIRSAPLSFYGMTAAHLGVAVFAVGVTLTSAYSVEKDIKLLPGQSYMLGGYEFRLDGVRDVPGPNYRAVEGQVTALKDGREVATLHPQKRVYLVQQNPMTEAAIDPGLTRDLYVALGDPLDGGAWSVRIYHKPFVRWIWLGALIMAFGGILSASDRRYRIMSRRAVTAGAEAAATSRA